MVINEEELKKITYATIDGVVKGLEQAAEMKFLKDMHMVLKAIEEKNPGVTVAQVCELLENILEDPKILHDMH